MAIKRIDLSPEREAWENAEYGEEVRTAGISSLQKTEDVINGSVDEVNRAVDDVAGAAADVVQAAKDAAGTVIRANETVDHADDVLADATEQATAAASSAELSQSWAVGGTGGREGENTNNSEYHSNQARTLAEAAKNEADRAAQYSQIVAPGFYFDPEIASLYMKTGVGVDFKASESRLYWRITP